MAEGRPARLFTTAGIGNERDARPRVTEALMATAAMVPSLAGRMLGAVGIRTDARSEITAVLDHPVGSGKRPPRADAALVVRRGRKRATLVFAVQVGDRKVSAVAVRKLRDAAKGTDIAAVVTIDNSPVGPDLGRSRSAVAVQHWPWSTVVSAIVDEKVRDPEQAAVLGDLVVFLRDPDARVVVEGDMGPNWSKVLRTARTSRLSARDAGVVDVARRWDQVVASQALVLGSATGRDVQAVIGAAEARDPERRIAGIVDRAVSSGRLEGVFRVPDAVGEMAVVADLTGRRLVGIVAVEAPDGLGARATVGWLLDGLAGAPTDAVIEAWAARASAPLAVATLGDLEEDMGLLDSRRTPTSFRVLLATEMPAARRAFVDGVAELVQSGWTRVLGPLSGEPVPRRAPTRRSSDGRTVRTERSSTSRTSSTRRSSSGTRQRTSSSESHRITRSSSSSSTRKSPAELAQELRDER